MNYLAHIADRVLGRPLLIHADKLNLIVAALGDRIGVDMAIARTELAAIFTDARRDRPAASRMVGETVGSPRAPLYQRVGGVGIIPVVGSLVNRGVAIGEDSSGFTSYESLGTQLDAAMSDPLVRQIMLDIDSTGGEAAGLFALTQMIRNARTQKPITSVVNDMAASAAYGIASASTEVVASPTSTVGHIGAVMIHLDRSEAMKMKGVKPTMVYAGAHKVDGHPFGPLSSEVQGDLQREVDSLYGLFVDQVAAGRPKLTTDAIKATEARSYLGAEATARGLVDRLGTFDETLARLMQANRLNIQQGAIVMTMQNNELIARADHEAAVAAARSEGQTAGRSEGEAAGRAQALARVQAILTCPEAEGRSAQAMVFALESDLAPEIAAKALAASPTVAAVVPALAARGNPAHVEASTEQPKQDSASMWNDVVAKVNAENTKHRRFA
jgi:signal peptide peptidase SppA